MRVKMLKIFSNEFWKKLVKNVATVLIGNGGASLINLVVTFLMIKAIGNTGYGLIAIALQYMNLLDGIVNFQSWSGVIKYGSEARVANNRENLYSIFKAGFLIDISTAILGGGVALAILPIASDILEWQNEILVMALFFSFEIFFHIEGTSIGVLRLYDKFKYTAAQSIIAALIKLILIGGYVLLRGKSVLVITILYVITDIVKHLILVIMAIYVLHNNCGIKKVASASLKYVNKDFIKYTLWSNIALTVDVPVKYFDIFIIGQISVEMVAIYKVFKQMIQMLSMLTNPISMAILPQFSELAALGKEKEAYDKVKKLRKIILEIGLVLILVSASIGKPVLTFVLGKEYGDNLLLFETLFVTSIYMISNTAVHPFCASLGLAKQDFYITLITNLLYMLFAFATVKIIGIYSVVLAYALQGTIFIWLKTAYIKKLGIG